MEEVVAGLRRLVMGIKKKKRRRNKIGVLIWLIPLGVEQSWQGDFLFLARNFSWVIMVKTKQQEGLSSLVERLRRSLIFVFSWSLSVPHLRLERHTGKDT